MIKIRKGLTAAIILLLCSVFFGCVNHPDDVPIFFGGGDDEIDTDILTNPGMKNPLTGVWKTGNKYWRFRSNGTGGKASTEKGPFPDSFSFFVYRKSQFYESSSNKQQSLVILDNSGNVTRYLLDLSMIEDGQAILTMPSGGGDQITLERVSGVPCALGLKNSLIGEYTATWYAANGTQSNGTWSIAYYADGTAKFYHLTAGHQFQNSYLIRGDKLVIYGNMRFGGLNATITPIVAAISKQGDGTLKILETSGISYVYTKTAAATWKSE